FLEVSGRGGYGLWVALDLGLSPEGGFLAHGVVAAGLILGGCGSMHTPPALQGFRKSSWGLARRWLPAAPAGEAWPATQYASLGLQDQVHAHSGFAAGARQQLGFAGLQHAAGVSRLDVVIREGHA